MHLSETSLEWALVHLRRFYSSDFFPEPFEFRAIQTQWSTVKDYLLKLDVSNHVPHTALRLLAPKPNGTFRVVHQLDPLDSIIYTSLVHSVAVDIEGFRIPESEHIACSYRIAPDVNGSFFRQMQDGWKTFTERSKKLAAKYDTGVVIVTDLVDFYNQIYSHRIQNVISEIGKSGFDETGQVLESFIEALNTQTSRGIPVGPAASIVLSEAILADIDRKVLGYTRDYARYSDDFRIFFPDLVSARAFLHDFTEYLHDNHRLVISGEKTTIMSVNRFTQQLLTDDEMREQQKLEETRNKVAMEKYVEKLIREAGPYDDPSEQFDHEDYLEVLQKLSESEEFRVVSDSYRQIFESEIASSKPDFMLLRRVLRNAGAYRIRSIFETVIRNFTRLLPLVRETGIYITRVITKEVASRYLSEFGAFAETPEAKLPFVNMWLSHIFSNQAFGQELIPASYDTISSVRDRALIALRRNDRAWVKSHKSGLDTLGPWDKRAVLFASQILSMDERKAWLRVAKARGTFLEQILADHLIAF